jgi:hypothetical protein
LLQHGFAEPDAVGVGFIFPGHFPLVGRVVPMQKLAGEKIFIREMVRHAVFKFQITDGSQKCRPKEWQRPIENRDSPLSLKSLQKSMLFVAFQVLMAYFVFVNE